MTCNYSTIVIDSDKIKKTYKNTFFGRQRFYKELFFYFRIHKLKLDYVPRLIKFNKDNLWFELSNVGISLDILLYRKKKKHLNPIIIDLHNKFKRDTLMYHNDIRYKNVCYNNVEDKYYLIDFEYCNYNFRDGNHQKILDF